MYFIASQKVVNFVEEGAFINNEISCDVKGKHQPTCLTLLPICKRLHSHSNNFQIVIEI